MIDNEITTYYELSDEDIIRLKRWRHFRARGDQTQRFIKINQETKRLAEKFMEMCPRSRELSSALTRLEEARLHANMAIMKNEDHHGCPSDTV